MNIPENRSELQKISFDDEHGLGKTKEWIVFVDTVNKRLRDLYGIDFDFLDELNVDCVRNIFYVRFNPKIFNNEGLRWSMNSPQDQILYRILSTAKQHIRHIGR